SDQLGLSRTQLDGVWEQQLLRGQRPGVQLAQQALEQHALVSHVLVHEEHLVLGGRDQERVLELADYRPEARRRERRALLAQQQRLPGRRRVVRVGTAVRRLGELGERGGHFRAPAYKQEASRSSRLPGSSDRTTSLRRQPPLRLHHLTLAERIVHRSVQHLL